VDVAAALDDALGQRKSDGERFEIARGAHHDGVRNAVEDERDWPFLTDAVDGDFGDTAALAAHFLLDDAGLFGLLSVKRSVVCRRIVGRVSRRLFRRVFQALSSGGAAFAYRIRF
jgi:hypothetical protein